MTATLSMPTNTAPPFLRETRPQRSKVRVFPAHVAAIKNAVNILEVVGAVVELRRQGKVFCGRCPWHSSKSGKSFQISPDRGTWRCWSCNIGGDVFAFVRRYYNFSFTDAVLHLARRAGIDVTQAPSHELETRVAQQTELARINQELRAAEKSELRRLGSELSDARRLYRVASERLMEIEDGAPIRFNDEQEAVMPDGSVRRVRRTLRLGLVREIGKQQALEALEPYLKAANAKALPPVTKKSGRTFAQHVEEWQKLIMPTIKPTTARQAASHLRTHVLPMFGEVPVRSVSVQAVQILVVELQRKNLSGVTIHHVIRTFHNVLKFAKLWGFTAAVFDMAALSMPRTVKRKESRCFTAAEANAIVTHSEEPHATLWALLALTGCRIGEALALRVSDLDFEHRVIRVEQTLDHATRTMLAPKSESSKAAVPMPLALQQRLLEFMAKHWRPNTGDLLFCNRKGKPMQRDKVTYKLQDTLATLGIPKGSPHGFRHMVASELLNRRVSPYVVQRQLRHSDSKVTMERYAHLIGNTRTDAMDELAGSVMKAPSFGVQLQNGSQKFAN